MLFRSAVEVYVSANAPGAKVQIGSNPMRTAEDTQEVKLTGDLTIVPLTIYSYPYGETDKVVTDLHIKKMDIGLDSVMYAKNSASANRIIKADKYGEYTVYIPASENSGVLTAIANTVAADVAVYKEGSATPIKTGDKGMLDKAELTGMNAEENKFKIVAL